MTPSGTSARSATRKETGNGRPRSRPRPFRYRKKFSDVYRFQITLQNIEPAVWRCIEVPGRYTFWDLHCAITDAFGWLDYHLHEFKIRWPESGEQDLIGIPDEDAFEGDPLVLPGWNLAIAEYFSPEDNPACSYTYDFGDGWRHEVKLEAIQPRKKGVGYPRCTGGERACPPEDVGGPPGYERFRKAISCLNAADHDELLAWCGGWFDPEWFDPKLVRFGNPDTRWRIAFEGEPVPEGMRTVQYHMEREDMERQGWQ